MVHILNIVEDRRTTPWLCFESLESGRAFLHQVPGYHFTKDESGEIDDEWLEASAFPDYAEIDLHGTMVPISKYMFEDSGKVQIYFYELPLMTAGQGLITGATRIDAYSIPNDCVQSYVEKREKLYSRISSLLNTRGIKTTRAYHGSQDGEAILYRKPNDESWYFLDHMDPNFVDLCDQSNSVLERWLDDRIL